MTFGELAALVQMPIEELRYYISVKTGKTPLSKNSIVEEYVWKGLFQQLEIDKDNQENQDNQKNQEKQEPVKPEKGKNQSITEEAELHNAPEKIFRTDSAELLSREDSDQSGIERCNDTAPAPGHNLGPKQFFGRSFYTPKVISYCLEKNYTVIVDTCTLLDDSFIPFYNEKLRAELYRLDRKIKVPYLVMCELEEIAVDGTKDAEVRRKASVVKEFINTQKFIEIDGDEADKCHDPEGNPVAHADRVIVERILGLRNNERNVLLLTQDRSLAIDSLRNNDLQSIRSDAVILALRLKNGGYLNENYRGGLPNPNPLLPKELYINGNTELHTITEDTASTL